MNIRIKGTQMELNGLLYKHIEEKIRKLEKYYQNILSVAVELGLVSKHHHKGEIYRAEANLRVPGHLLRAEYVSEDIFQAFDRMYDELKSMLKEYKLKEKSNIPRVKEKTP